MIIIVPLLRTSLNCLGIWSRCLQDASLWTFFGHVQLGWEPDAEHTGGITHPTWPGQAFRITQEQLRDVVEGKEVDTTLLSLQPPHQVPLYTAEDGWNCNRCVHVLLCMFTFLQHIRRQWPPLLGYHVCNGIGHSCLCLGLIHQLEMCLCVCVSVCVWKRLIKAVHQLCSTDTCLSKEKKGLAEIDSGGSKFAHT